MCACRRTLTQGTGSHPSVVVWPASTEDVVKVVKIAVKYRMPVIPYSGATSLEGHFRAVRLEWKAGWEGWFVLMRLARAACRRGHLRRPVEDGQYHRNPWSVWLASFGRGSSDRVRV